MGKTGQADAGVPNLVSEEELLDLAMQDNSFRVMWDSLISSINKMPVDDRLKIMNASREVMVEVAGMLQIYGPTGTLIALTVVSELSRRTTELAQANPEKSFSLAHLPSVFCGIVRDQIVIDLQKED